MLKVDEDVVALSSTEKKSTDLCMQERDTGARCMRTRGHDGKHECLVWPTGTPLRWE